ncbi:MAG: group I truncated hemoglobin [Gammaproteobacteria bacterium]
MAIDTLYARLGGYDGISAVVESLLKRLMADRQLVRFWQYRGLDGIRREKQLLVDYLCANTGGSMYYTGRDMKMTHQGMGINNSDWALFICHLQAVMDEFEVGEKERADVLALVLGTKNDIIE